MKLNYKVFGEGTPVIILHGLLGSLDNWQTIAKKLGETFKVFTVDQRNHGKSPHTDQMNYPAMAGDVKELMEQEQLPHAAVIGHSMGGKTAMQLALNFPEKVDRLIPVDMGPKANSPGHELIFSALKAMDLSKVKKRQDAEAQLKSRIPDFGIRQFLLKNLERTEDGQYQWKMNLPVIEKEYPRILEAVEGQTQFDKPTLFIKGGRSDYIDEAEFEDFKAWFPQAELSKIPDSGHWVHAEAPEAFLDEVERFLK